MFGAGPSKQRSLVRVVFYCQLRLRRSSLSATIKVACISTGLYRVSDPITIK